MTLAGTFEIALTLAVVLVAAYPVGASWRMCSRIVELF
jgi:hypothetical protein